MYTANKKWAGYNATLDGAGYLDAYAAKGTNTNKVANTGIVASQLLSTGSDPITWGSVGWNSVGWNSVGWNSVGWNSVGWNSVGWNSVVGVHPSGMTAKEHVMSEIEFIGLINQHLGKETANRLKNWDAKLQTYRVRVYELRPHPTVAEPPPAL